jgi:hypothetical protein
MLAYNVGHGLRKAILRAAHDLDRKHAGKGERGILLFRMQGVEGGFGFAHGAHQRMERSEDAGDTDALQPPRQADPPYM